MNRLELVSVVSEELGMTKKDINLVLDGILEAIYNSLENGEKVVISGFGTFEIRTRAAHSGANPRTGEIITIPASKLPGFKAGATFKERVR